MLLTLNITDMANKLFLALSLTFLLHIKGFTLTTNEINNQFHSPSFLITDNLIFPDTVTQVETSIAVHPLNPMILAATAVTDVYPGGYTTAAFVSSNGGVNWSGTNSIRDSTGSIIVTLGNPKICIDKNGIIIISYIAPSHFSGGRDYKVGVSYSTNNGIYWSRTVYIPGIDTADKSVCATDDVSSSAYFGRSYVVYNERRGIYFASTADGGKIWTTAKKISPPLYYIRTGAFIAVGQSGEIYVTWPYLKDSQKYIGFARSTNGGSTWDSTDTAIPVNPLKGDFRINLNLVKLNGIPSIAVDNSGGVRNGWLYVVSSERVSTGSPALDSCDIIVRCSSDKGVSWPLKYRVNQDIGSLKYQIFPAINVDKYGGINVVYYDTRNTPTRDSFEVYISRSLDGGLTFKDTLISNHKFHLKQMVPAKWLFAIPGYIGTGIGICSTNNKIFPVWFDNYANDEYQARLGSLEMKLPSFVKIIPQAYYDVFTLKLNSRDTVKILLRSSQSPYAPIDSAKGILDSVTFQIELDFKNANDGNYFIEVSHRNSINTWSKNAVLYSNASGLNYDFTDSASKAFGDNMILKGTKWCMYSGDVHKDGIIDPTDLITIDNDASNFETGYIDSDVNGDGIVDSSDMIVADNNAMNYVVIATP